MNSSIEAKNLILPKIVDSKLYINNLYKKPMNKYFINLLKLSKIKRENSAKIEENKILKEDINNIKKDNITILNLSKKKPIKIKSHSKTKRKKKIGNKNSAISLKYFFNIVNKNRLQKSLSYIYNNSIEKYKTNLESNFMKLKNDSNIYTSNVNYIKNKKMLIIDKFSYDNNIYKPDRLGLFEMSDFHNPKYKIGKGIFGHIYYNHNKYRKCQENRK